jgi:hypothetical protein
VGEGQAEDTYTPALVCLLAREMRNANQGHLTVDESPEIGTRGLSLCQVGFTRSELVLACLARGLALTNKPVLYCIDRAGHGALAPEKQRGMGIVIGQFGASLIQTTQRSNPTS